MRQTGLFGLSDRLKRLSADGGPLETLGRIVDFEAFRPTLAAALAYGDGAKGGRPPYHPVAMFKVLILTARNTVSDTRMEYLTRDRLSWLRFLDFDFGAPTPDANTIQLFREKLTEASDLEKLCQLKERGYIAILEDCRQQREVSRLVVQCHSAPYETSKLMACALVSNTEVVIYKFYINNLTKNIGARRGHHPPMTMSSAIPTMVSSSENQRKPKSGLSGSWLMDFSFGGTTVAVPPVQITGSTGRSWPNRRRSLRGPCRSAHAWTACG